MKNFCAGMLCMAAIMLMGFQSIGKKYEYNITEDSFYNEFHSFDPNSEEVKRVDQSTKISNWSKKYGRLVQVVIMPKLNSGKAIAHYYWEK